LRKLHGRLVAGAARGNLCVGAEVNPAAQECPGGDDDGPRAELASVGGLDAADPRPVEDQICDHALGQLKRRETFEQLARGPAIEGAIALRAGGPDGRTLGPIEHAELDRGQVGDAAHEATEGVDFADHSALGDAADGGIAGKLADGFEVRCKK